MIKDNFRKDDDDENGYLMVFRVQLKKKQFYQVLDWKKMKIGKVFPL